MKWFAETTDWKDAVPNGIYLLDDAKTKMYAFRSGGTGKIKTFRNFIRIDARGRKFVINPDQYPTSVPVEIPQGRVHEVTGSKGDVYLVTELNGMYSCTCSGFKFRSQCRHIESLK